MSLFSGVIKDKFEGTITSIFTSEICSIFSNRQDKYLEFVIESDHKGLNSNIKVPKGNYLLEELLMDYNRKKKISIKGDLTFEYLKPLPFLPFLKFERTTNADLTILINQKPKYKINIKTYHTVPIKPKFSFQYVR